MIDAIIIVVVCLLVGISIRYSSKRKKSGQSSCGSTCAGCPSAQSCSSIEKKS